jgi:hypothetical protein
MGDKSPLEEFEEMNREVEAIEKRIPIIYETHLNVDKLALES